MAEEEYLLLREQERKKRKNNQLLYVLFSSSLIQTGTWSATIPTRQDTLEESRVVPWMFCRIKSLVKYVVGQHMEGGAAVSQWMRKEVPLPPLLGSMSSK